MNGFFLVNNMPNIIILNGLMIWVETMKNYNTFQMR